MQPLRRFLIAAVFVAVPTIAQQGDSSTTPVRITGAVLSLSGNILDVKPSAAPAVWVTIPADLHVDRSALKEGVNVSIEAHWVDVCYVASQITVQK